MDSRLHVAPALGLALGDAHILRNAGGRVTEDMIRSLVISQQQMGTREIVVLHHTDCGAQTFENEAFRQHLKKELGVEVGDQDFLPFKMLKRVFVKICCSLKRSPLIPNDVVISGQFMMWILDGFNRYICKKFTSYSIPRQASVAF